MLDESSLASTRQMRAFLQKLKAEDRVLVIGDSRQHQAVDAGRPFQQMQEAAMQTSQLDKIMRQKDPELSKAVQHLANDETLKGIELLAEQGRVTEERVLRTDSSDCKGLCHASGKYHHHESVRAELLKPERSPRTESSFGPLLHRSDMRGVDRTWAARYNPAKYCSTPRVARPKASSATVLLPCDR